MGDGWQLPAASLLLLLLLLQLAGAREDDEDFVTGPRNVNIRALTCEQLAYEGADPLYGCRFSVVTAEEQQVSCKLHVIQQRKDGIVSTYRKKLLNTMSYRLEQPMEKGVYCASFASIDIRMWNAELQENHTIGELPPAFLSFLNFFTDDSYSRVRFTKRIPVARVYLRPECHNLSRAELKEDCVDTVMFIREVKGGSFKLVFANDDYWSFMKRRFVGDFGGEMTHLSVTSSGELAGVPLPFLTLVISSDLHMRELKLANITMGALRGPLVIMPTLRVLRLPDDSITSISQATLQPVAGLLELDLSGNELRALPPSLPAGLRALNVSRNMLSALSSELPAPLATLNISYNSIQTLPETLPAGLRTVDASRNLLQSLPQGLPAALRVLDVSHNRLQMLPTNLPPSLRVLQVSHNQLQALRPQLLAALQELRVLDASHNRLSQVEDLWLSHQLQLLNVSHNQLQRISLLGPGNVSHVDASYNHIEAWKVQAQRLSLPGNPRSPLGLESARSGTATTIIDMGDSLLLNCDPCASDSEIALRLHNWLIRQRSNRSVGGPLVVRPAQPVCTEPQEWAGVALEAADHLDDRFGCPGSPRYVAKLALLVICPLALLAAAALYCYYRRYEITYMIHLVKMRRERLAAEKRDPTSYKYDAFVCYSNADRAWVVGQLLPKLEHAGDSPDELPLRLCLHERDFPLGSFITENILTSMKNSRSTVIILSQAFVDSQWCRWELDLASQKVPQLVLLELQKLERSRLPRHLRYLMDTRTYVEWPAQPRAREATWKRLRATLAATRPSPSTAAADGSRQNQNVGEADV